MSKIRPMETGTSSLESVTNFLLDAVFEDAEIFFFQAGDQAIQRIGDRDVDERHADVNFDPLSRLDLRFGGFLRRFDGALRLVKSRGGEQNADNKSDQPDRNPISSCHHRIACLRRTA